MPIAASNGTTNRGNNNKSKATKASSAETSLLFDTPTPVVYARQTDVHTNGSIAKHVNIDNIRRKWLFKVPTHVQEGTSAYMRIDPQLQRFPCHDELQALPDEVRTTVQKTALAVLHWRLLPIVMIWMRRHVKAKLLRAAMSTTELSSPPSSHFLSSLTCFARWENMNEVAKALTPTVLVQDEVLIHNIERETAALVILGFGFATADAAPNRIIGAPSVLGKITVHSQHRQSGFVRVVSQEAIVWTLSYRDYHTFLRAQPPDVYRFHLDNAVLYRERKMKFEYKRLLVEAELLRHSEFAAFRSLDVADLLPGKFQPKSFRPGQLIYKSGEPATTVLYLVSGTVAIHSQSLGLGGFLGAHSVNPRGAGRRGGEPSSNQGSRRGSLTHLGGGSSVSPSSMAGSLRHGGGGGVGGAGLAFGQQDFREFQFPLGTKFLSAPCVIGDISWIQASKRRRNVCAVTACDFLVLPKDSMKSAISSLDSRQLMAREQRQAERPPADRRMSQGGRKESQSGNAEDDSSSSSTPANQDASATSLGQQTKPRGQRKQRDADDVAFLKYIPYVRSIPLLSKYLPPEDESATSPLIRELAEAIQPVVFAPRSTIVSSTQICTQILFIQAGRALIVRDENERRIRALKVKQLAEKEKLLLDKMSSSMKAERKPSVSKPSRFGEHISGAKKHLKGAPHTCSPSATPRLPALRSHTTEPTTSSSSNQQPFPPERLTMNATPPPLPTFALAGGGPSITPQHNGLSEVERARMKELGNKQSLLAHGECIGFPLLHPHKWLHRVIALDTVEGLQLSYDSVKRVLSKYGLRKKINDLSFALVNPTQETDEELKAEAIQCVEQLKNPPMYSTTPPIDGEPALCRQPTDSSLARLPPIPLQNRLSTCVFGAASMTRFSAEKLAPIETGAALQPIILGAHNKRHLPYAGRK